MDTRVERTAVAELAEARDEIEEMIRKRDRPPPHWWPLLDLAVRELDRESDYSDWELARSLNNLPIGPAFGELRTRIRSAAFRLVEKGGD